MTVEAWEQLGDLATSSATSRSEVLEVLIRSALLRVVDIQEERQTLLTNLSR